MNSHDFDDSLVLRFPVESVTAAVSHDEDESAVSVTREYTVQSLDPENSRLSVDFLVHEHGVASQWSQRARAQRSADFIVK
ncbi:siderophore-interacting protein [Glutamicibacter sp. JC586]|uniref:siderophore-interacting protein n=1 Tax=Glutamicibacter sp. JC586 TaxID=2590552 RepID=UPI001357DAE9|nr:siderophore-interacting protein [Glutamicibacter sp. JC586]